MGVEIISGLASNLGDYLSKNQYFVITLGCLGIIIYVIIKNYNEIEEEIYSRIKRG